MTTKRKLIPGQPGTKKLQQKYGDNLVCVRYRYDTEHKRRLKTVELIVEERPWSPNKHRVPKNKIVGLQISYDEIHLRKIVKAAGGRWNSGKKLWLLRYGEVEQLGLTNRIRKGTNTENV